MNVVPDRIEKHTLLRAPLERVWNALTDSRQFGLWFGVTFDGPFTLGERIVGRVTKTTVDAEIAKHQEPYEGQTFGVTIDRLEPRSVFAFTWNPHGVDAGVDYSKEPQTLVVFTLKETPDGVLLTVVESGFHGVPLERRAEAFKANDGGWAMQMILIEKYLAQAA